MPPPEPPSLTQFEPAGDEALLPAGIRLADETRLGRLCFVLLEGSATVEVAGIRLRELGAGAFIGSTDQAGHPLPPAGLTVRLATPSRVLVIDAGRLAGLIDTDATAAATWHRMRPQL